MKLINPEARKKALDVVPYIGTWIETVLHAYTKQRYVVVPYIGTWIETPSFFALLVKTNVVPYIGTWIETPYPGCVLYYRGSYLI